MILEHFAERGLLCMETETTEFASFLAWLQAFDPSALTNEAEVESKFVVPFFQH